MLKKLLNLLTKQQRIKGAGEFVETLSLTLFWGSVVNIIMNAGTFYYTTLRYIIPWFDIGTFIIVMGVGVIIAYVVTFKFIAPSLWAFRGRMMNNEPQSGKKIRVAIAGGFDPLHFEHVHHIKEAMKLGDWLIVILSTDEILTRKKGKPFMKYNERKEILEAIIGDKGEIVPNLNKEGLDCVETIIKYKPDIFAKGGDSWNEKTLPEYQICQELGVKIIFGVGGFVSTQSSSKLIKGL